MDLDDPATTLELLKLDAVVGVTGIFDEQGQDHLDGHPVRAVPLDRRQFVCAAASAIGATAGPIAISMSAPSSRSRRASRRWPALLGTDVATVRAVLNSWGPGRFDAVLFMDGKAFRPDGKSASVLIPPAFGLAGVNLHTWTGWGGVSHWNAFVANLEMHGKGTFFDPRLDDATHFPIAARERFGHVQADEDLITPLLPALQIYQLTLPVPPRRAAATTAAPRNAARALFNGKAKCSGCHVPPLYHRARLEHAHRRGDRHRRFPGDPRSPDGRYRTTPLRGLWTHTNGGFYHDGRFPTLAAVIDHYDSHFSLA